MTSLRRTGSALSLLAWLLPGAVAQGLVLHVAAEHSVASHHGHGSQHHHAEDPHSHPHPHAAAPHSHPPSDHEHPRDHHEEMTILLAAPSTSSSRVDLASGAIVLQQSVLLAPTLAWSGREPDPVPRGRPANLLGLHSVLRI